MSTKSSNPWDWDVRVRDRNLKAGIFSEKELEKMLSTLPDLTGQAEAVSVAQPALVQREAP